MHEVCKFLSVVRENGVEEDGSYFVVENCAKVDTALAGFVVVCFNEQLNSLFEFLDDRVSSVKDYVVENINSGNYKFAMDLIRETLHLTTYTEEFIGDAGSVQNFLDLYGIGSNNIEFAEMAETELPSEQIDFSSLAAVETAEEPEDVVLEESSLLNKMSEEATEEENTWLPTKEEMSSKPLPTFSPEPLTQEETNALLGKPEEPLVEPEELEETPEETETPEEPKIPEEPKTPEEPKAPEESVYQKPVKVYDNSAASIEYAVECSGVEIEGATFKDGKISVRFEELSKFVNSVMQVAGVLESKDSVNRKTLTVEDLEAAASEVDKYAPSIVKEFLIRYVLKAEKDMDLLRVTALLDDFCTYISERNLMHY